MRILSCLFALAAACLVSAAESAPNAVEQQVLDAVKSPKVTIVHLWAPWCSNCKAELSHGGWSSFLSANPDVNVIFVTVWKGEGSDGRALLEQNGLGSQPNFQLLVHPNGSRKKAERMTEFLGQPVSWIPSTWVFREGTLRYALNYGELRFPMLQQLVRDSSDSWEH
jgi:thiol-disulfide isomerase/thioredoxin